MADIAESDAKGFQDYEALVFDDEFGERSTALWHEGTARRCGRRLRERIVDFHGWHGGSMLRKGRLFGEGPGIGAWRARWRNKAILKAILR
jgi:hypothetical protein